MTLRNALKPIIPILMVRSFEFYFQNLLPPSLQDSDRSPRLTNPTLLQMYPTQLNLNDGCGPLSMDSLLLASQSGNASERLSRPHFRGPLSAYDCIIAH